MIFRFAALLMLYSSISPAMPPLLSEKDLVKAPLLPLLKTAKDQKRTKNYFWICADDSRTTIHARCNEAGNEEIAVDEERKGVIELNVTANAVAYDYDFRHARPVQECRAMARQFQKIKAKNLRYCILGKHYIEPGSRLRSHPIFFQLKSPLGYIVDMDTND